MPDVVGEPELEGVTPSPGDAGTAGPDDGAGGDDGGDDREPPTARAATWLRDRARRHPLVTATALVAVAAAALATATLAVPDPSTPTALPDTLTVTLDAGPGGDQPLWRTDGQGRPAGPPVLPSTLGVIAPPGTRIPLLVTGILGPGVLRDGGSPSPAVAGATTTAAVVHPVLDCDRLPAPTDPGAGTAYQVRLLVGSGAQQAARTVPVPAAGGWLQTAVQACRGWRARRDLTVTGLVARVDPASSRLVVDATVRNAGRRPAVLGPARSACCTAAVESGGALRVPPGAQATASWSLWLPICDAASASVSGAAPVAVDPWTTDRIGLAALSGPELPVDLTMFQPSAGPYTEQLNPTGVVLARDAAAALTDGLRRACGRLSLPVLLVPRGGVRLDLATGRLQVDAVLDVSPGLVGSVRIDAEAADPRAEDIRPTWSSLGPLTPDRTGQVPLRLTYRITGPRLPCLDLRGGGVPGFLITLQVPEGASIRTVRYLGNLSLDQDPAAGAGFCVNP